MDRIVSIKKNNNNSELKGWLSLQESTKERILQDFYTQIRQQEHYTDAILKTWIYLKETQMIPLFDAIIIKNMTTVDPHLESRILGLVNATRLEDPLIFDLFAEKVFQRGVQQQYDCILRNMSVEKATRLVERLWILGLESVLDFHVHFTRNSIHLAQCSLSEKDAYLNQVFECLVDEYPKKAKSVLKMMSPLEVGKKKSLERQRRRKLRTIKMGG